MYDFENSYSYSTLGMGMTVPKGDPVKANPRRDYTSAGPAWLSPDLLYSIPATIDDLTRQFGPRIYAAMMTDSCVSAQVNGLKLAMAAATIKLLPPDKLKPPAWFGRSPDSKPKSGTRASPKPGAKPKPADDPAPKLDPGKYQRGDKSLSPEQSQALEAVEFCERLMARLGESLLTTRLGLLDAMVDGSKLAEVTFKVADDGTDAGKLVWDTVAVKPWWSWRFMVDYAYRVNGILTWSGAEARYLVLKPDKFLWHSWMPTDSDPRGNSILRAAYNPWNLKVQAWPQYYQFLTRFGSPGIDGEMAEGDTEDRTALDADGNEVPGTTVPPSVHFKQALSFYKAGGIVVHPFGSKVNVFEPKSSGEAFNTAFDLYDRQICLAVEHQARATIEAKHGSKADSETAQDTKGVILKFGGMSEAAVWRRAFRIALTMNFGQAYADQFTPQVQVGETEHQDRPGQWSAAASLQSSGYLGPSQLEEMDALMGLPVRDPEADLQAADDAATKAADLAAKSAPPKPGDTVKTGSKPTPKPKGPTK